MKISKLLNIFVITVLLIMAVPVTSAEAAVSMTVTKGDVSLSGGFQSGNFPETWDLTSGDLALGFTYDANGLVDDSGAHAWAELGIRDVSTASNFNPNNKGIWLTTDYDGAAGTFDPDVTPTLDLDDKLLLQKVSGNGEGAYDLPSVPPVSGNNHRFWWDRDGVDPWQNGETANTNGLYEIVITLHATSATTGTAFMKINGLNQGFETDGNWSTIELTPAGMTFAGDMTSMQVFYGIYGEGATHSIRFKNISITGYAKQCTDTCYVDAVNGNDAFGGNAGDPKKTIQAAINQVSTGGTVHVAAGTYPEQILISKPMTVAGEDGAVLDGTGLAPQWTTGVRIRSGNVTYNNIDVTNYTQDGITAYDNIDMPNLHITNSKISNIQPGYWGFGIYVGYESEGFEYSPPDLTGHLDFSGLLIEGNEITNVHSSALVVQSLTGTPGTLQVKNNHIHDNTTNSGIWIDSARNVLIEDNTLVNNKVGVEFSAIPEFDNPTFLNGPYSPKDITLRGNDISGSTLQGIVLSQAWPDTFILTGNNITGNETGLDNQVAGTLNATCNWWNAVNGPAGIGPGSGDAITGNVLFQPWLTSAAPSACSADGPVTYDIRPATVAVNTAALLTAVVDDTEKGGNFIASAEYKIDNLAWSPLNADDTAFFDEVVEEVQAPLAPFKEPGIHNVCVRGTDAAGNLGTEQCASLVVYNPKGRFVTGGGWILSPAGADKDHAARAGQATFSFVSKYKKGATVPEGYTEFQFKAGNLKFHSIRQEWLVVNQRGTLAQLKGYGTINKAGNYAFMLWAGDGFRDTFHIKIWDAVTGDVVYDNGINQPIRGGSIVIHKAR